jgi:hypothetical protein
MKQWSAVSSRTCPAKGNPIDLTAYFDTPQEVRMAHSILKNAGMAPREVDLLKKIAELKQVLATVLAEKEAGNPKADREEAAEFRYRREVYLTHSASASSQ